MDTMDPLVAPVNVRKFHDSSQKEIPFEHHSETQVIHVLEELEESNSEIFHLQL